MKISICKNSFGRQRRFRGSQRTYTYQSAVIISVRGHKCRRPRYISQMSILYICVCVCVCVPIVPISRQLGQCSPLPLHPVSPSLPQLSAANFRGLAINCRNVGVGVFRPVLITSTPRPPTGLMKRRFAGHCIYPRRRLKQGGNTICNCVSLRLCLRWRTEREMKNCFAYYKAVCKLEVSIAWQWILNLCVQDLNHADKVENIHQRQS